MRHYILLFILFTSVGYSYSQTMVPGYYVTTTNDTINCQVKLPKPMFSKSVVLSGLLHKVEVTDSVNGSKKFKPGDIRSFEFIYNENKYTFYSPACNKDFNAFFQAVILGQKTNLYTYQTVTTSGQPLGAIYTFEKADGSCTFLNIAARKLDFFRKTLKEFYKENIEIQQLIDKKFKYRAMVENDMREIVRAVNKQIQ